MKLTRTKRGFPQYAFLDSYGEDCSIQQSSSAEVPCIWLGTSHPAITLFLQDHGKYQKLTEEELKERLGVFDVMQSTRMHLTQRQVAELLPILQRFVETGEIVHQEQPDSTSDPATVAARLAAEAQKAHEEKARHE